MTIKINGKMVHVSELFCDKLTFTIDYQSPIDQKTILENINEFLSLKLHVKRHSGHRYHHRIFVYEGEYPSEMQMLIEVNPKVSGISFFRFDFNPAHCDMEAVAAFLQNVLPGGLDDVAKKAKVTRLDLTVDFIGIHIDKMLIAYPGMQVSKGHYKSGKTETLYVGGYECAKLVVLYDKVQQVKHLNATKHMKLQEPVDPTTRLELRLRPDAGIDQLRELPNPYIKLILSTVPLLSKTEQQLWRLFIAVAQFRGLQDALLMIEDKYQRKKFKETLGGTKPTWWKPESVWTGWIGLLEHVFMVKLPNHCFQTLVNVD